MTPKYTYIYLQQTHIFLLHIFGWMTNNRLNANIRDYIIIGTSRHRKSTHFFPTPIHIRNITPSPTVRNLGFTFDSDFNFIKHISLACRCYLYHIRDLRRIRRYITLSVAKTIATARITSRLDYCNSLLCNIAFTDILNLRCVQKCLARVVTWSPWFSHSVPLLKSLHWLPFQSRIMFKLCTIVYQTLSSGEPSCLFSMLSLAPKLRELS